MSSVEYLVHRQLRCPWRCRQEWAKAWGKQDIVVALHRTYPICFTPASLWNWNWERYISVVAGGDKWIHRTVRTRRRIDSNVDSHPGNNIFPLLWEVNEYIEQYAPGEESIWTSVPTLLQIIADTAQQQNKWDDSPEGLTLKTMKHAVATHNKRRRLVDTSQDVLSLSLSSSVTPLPHIFPIKN